MNKRTKKLADTFSEKGTPGPERKVKPSWVIGSAENYRTQFSLAWDKIGGKLIAAKSPQEIVSVLESVPGMISIPPFGVERFSTLIFEIKNDPSFPRIRSKSQIRFLADSLGANGELSPRRSRDVCLEERSKAKRRTHIIRYEFYIECSCGYTGVSQNHACVLCKAEIGAVINHQLFNN